MALPTLEFLVAAGAFAPRQHRNVKLCDVRCLSKLMLACEGDKKFLCVSQGSSVKCCMPRLITGSSVKCCMPRLITEW